LRSALDNFTPTHGNGVRLREEHVLGSGLNHGGESEITLETLLNRSFEDQWCCQGACVDRTPRVANTVVDVDEDMELSTSWSRQGCTNGREPFMVDVSVPGDRIETSSKSSTEDTAADEQNQTNKKRPSKGKRDRYNKLIQRLQTQISENPEAFTIDEVVLPPSLQANDKQRLKLIEQMERYHHAVLTSIGG